MAETHPYVICLVIKNQVVLKLHMYRLLEVL